MYKGSGWKGGVGLAIAIGLIVEAVSAQDVNESLLFDDFEEWNGEELARTYCVSCHVFPEREELPRESWVYVLDLMGLYFGYDDGALLTSLESDDEKRNLFDPWRYPKEKTLSPLQWAAIRDYFEASGGYAAVSPPPDASQYDGFQAIDIFDGNEVPIVSMLKIYPDEQALYLGDAVQNRLLRFDAEGRLVDEELLPGAISQLEIGDDYVRATLMGNMHPSNQATGSIVERRRDEKEWTVLAKDLQRPVASLVEDYNGDGEPEALVSEFGHYQGSLRLHALGDDKDSLPFALSSESGAIGLQRLSTRSGAGFNVLALNAQARESLILYKIQEDLSFELEVLISKSPTFGYTQLILADISGDGSNEIITLNGDNADLPGPPLKSYHGVRVHSLSESLEISERVFLQVPGAFQARAGDFDGDGLQDIAVVSYFPDTRRFDQSFLLFRNLGNFQFERLKVLESQDVPWMTLDSGDIDGDGDLDIVLGSGYIGPKRTNAKTSPKPAARILLNRG